MDEKEHKILILEDSPTDAELMEKELRKRGLRFVSKRVMAREDFLNALRTFLPDIILSDYNLPQFDGLSALQIVREKSPDTPFIFVTGAIGDERAIETLKKGAVDYVLKDKLVQLMPAIERAFREVETANKLKEKISELEKLVNSMVGRELKMTELKEEIERLRQEKDARN